LPGPWSVILDVHYPNWDAKRTITPSGTTSFFRRGGKISATREKRVASRLKFHEGPRSPRKSLAARCPQVRRVETFQFGAVSSRRYDRSQHPHPALCRLLGDDKKTVRFREEFQCEMATIRERKLSRGGATAVSPEWEGSVGGYWRKLFAEATPIPGNSFWTFLWRAPSSLDSHCQRTDDNSNLESSSAG
jgi:hypothetical protein